MKIRAIVALLLLIPATAIAGGWWLGGGADGGVSSFQTPLTADLDADGNNISDIGEATGTTATFDTFVSPATGFTLGLNVPTSASVNAADQGGVKYTTKSLFAVVTQPATAGTAARTGSASDAIVTGTGSTVTLVPVFGILAATDVGTCGAAGTVDSTPSCAREVCSNMGLLCHDAINMTSFAAPALAATDCTTEVGAGTLVLVACY